jgi:hypothetical protein
MRRQLTDTEVLATVLRNWHARPPIERSVAHTGLFLWLLVLITLIGLGLGAWIQSTGRQEQDCDDRSHSGARIECVEGADAQASGEGNDVVHSAIVVARDTSKNVRRSAT